MMEDINNSVLTITVDKKERNEKIKILTLDELHTLILGSSPITQSSDGVLLMKNVLPVRFHPLITNGETIVVGVDRVYDEEYHFQWGQLLHLEQSDLNYCIDSEDIEMFYVKMFSSILRHFGDYFMVRSFDTKQIKCLYDLLVDGLSIHPVEHSPWFDCITVSNLLQTSTRLVIHCTETYMEVYFPIISKYRKSAFCYIPCVEAYDVFCESRDRRELQHCTIPFSTAKYFEANIRELNEVSWLLDNVKAIISQII